jgi:hypothetical protein
MTSPTTGIKVCLQVDRASFGGGVPFERVIYHGGRNEQGMRWHSSPRARGPYQDGHCLLALGGLGAKQSGVVDSVCLRAIKLP